MKKWKNRTKPFFGCPHCSARAVRVSKDGNRITRHYPCLTTVAAEREHIRKPRTVLLLLYAISALGAIWAISIGDVVNTISWALIIVAIVVLGRKIDTYDEE